MKVRDLDQVHAVFAFAVAAYSLVRLPKLLARRASCVQQRKKEANMTQRRGPFLRMNPFQARNFAPAHPLAQAQ